MWIQREIQPIIEEAASQRPAVLLTGCRQAGKTSLLERTFPGHNYVSLDLPATAEMAENAGERFLSRHEPPVIIDEVQYAPNLFRYIKHAIDGTRDLNGRFLLTGSQKFRLMQDISESLAGRVSIIELNSLSLSEIEKWSRKKVEGEYFLELMLKGGYPELHAKGMRPERFYSDYVATYLERDVRQAIHVRNLRDFDRFLRLCALRTGQLLSMNSLASDVGVSPNTIRAWLSVLEASGVIHILEPYFGNLNKRLIKTPKLYFLDTGLCCYLAGLNSAGDLENSALLGQIFETQVLCQIVRWHANRGKRLNMYFYRDQYGHEVDFILPQGKKFRLFECKWSDSPSLRVKGFKEMEKAAGAENIIKRSIITPVRGYRHSAQDDVSVEDCVQLHSLG